MVNHYFNEKPLSPSNRKEISFRFFGAYYTFITDNDVFSKDQVDKGSEILVNQILKHDLKGRILDYGCGYGVIGILLKSHFESCEIEGFDINQRAVMLANLNARKNDVDVPFYQASLIDTQKTYQHIVLNPPIRTGKDNIYDMFKQAHNQLESLGSLWIVIRKNHGAKSAMDYLETLFDKVELLEKNKGYFVVKSTKK